jgi:hypothetical protein
MLLLKLNDELIVNLDQVTDIRYRPRTEDYQARLRLTLTSVTVAPQHSDYDGSFQGVGSESRCIVLSGPEAEAAWNFFCSQHVHHDPYRL